MWSNAPTYNKHSYFNHTWMEEYESFDAVNKKELLMKMLNVSPLELFKLHPELFSTSKLSTRDKETLFRQSEKLYFSMGFKLEDLSTYRLYNILMYDQKVVNKYVKQKEVFQRPYSKSELSSLAKEKPAVFMRFGLDISRVNEARSIGMLWRHAQKHKMYAENLPAIVEAAKNLPKTEMRTLLLDNPELISAWKWDDTTLTAKEFFLLVMKPNNYHQWFKPFVTDAMVEDLKEGIFLEAMGKKTAMLNVERYLKQYEENKNFLRIKP